MPRAAQRWALGALVVAVLIAVLVELRAQVPGDEGLVLSADQALGEAMRSGDKSVARHLLALQFSYIDENGKAHPRKEFLGDLKGLAAGSAGEVKAKVYGRLALVTGHRKSANGSDVFFVDVWAKQKRAWRALVMQAVVLGAAAAPPATPATPSAAAKPHECKNPCQTIPYRVRSPAEQDIVNSFQAIEKAVIAHDAEEWSKHVGDEFMLYGSGRAPIAKSDRVAVINRQKESNAAVAVGEIDTMWLAVYGDGAVMTASHLLPDNSRPPYRAVRVWVRRDGQWLMALSVQTDVK